MPNNGGGVGKRVGIKESRESRTRSFSFLAVVSTPVHINTFRDNFDEAVGLSYGLKENTDSLKASVLMKKFRHYLLPHTFVIGEEISNFQAVGSQFNKGRVFYPNFAQTERIVKLR